MVFDQILEESKYEYQFINNPKRLLINVNNQDQNCWTQISRIHEILESPDQISASATVMRKIVGQSDVTKVTSLPGLHTY